MSTSASQTPPAPEAGPRVLRVRLDPERPPRAALEPFRPEAPLEDLAVWGGTALAAAWLFEHAATEPPPLVVAVGDAVRRGAPTAARAAVASRSPLTGRFADGQVGGDLGRTLARLCDALVIEGSLGSERSEVLVVAAERASEVSARLVAGTGLAGLDALEIGRALAERWPRAATLAVGPAGERGLPVASLVAGGTPPHFAGRGGLGAVLGRAGLKAVVVLAPGLEAPGGGPARPAARDEELVRLLTSSPRLLARAEGGTLELFDDLAARGSDDPSERRAARRVADQVADQVASGGARRHGCRGCPTPCGFEFVTRKGPKGARFGAARALGLELGLADFEDALELLDACDRVGVDAKEVGSALAILAAAREADGGPPLRGDAGALLAEIRGLAAPADDAGETVGPVWEAVGPGSGARALARALGLEARLAGAWLESGKGPASLLGQAVSARGTDPMRAFPFLASDTADPELARALVAPMPLEAGALDTAAPTSKGRLVWWHENLALALDATGFCAFSAAALLADGTVGLDALAARLVPERSVAEPREPGEPSEPREPGELAPGQRLLAAGEQLARLLVLLNHRWGAQGAAPASPELQRPGLFDEYAALRGLDRSGAPTPELEAAFRAGRATDSRAVLGAPPSEPGPSPGAGLTRASSPSEPFPGSVLLRSSGPLARALGRELRLELPLPAEVETVLAAAVRAVGAPAGELIGPGRPAPVVYRDGVRLTPQEPVRDGDRLDLLLVISGGAR